MGKDSKIEWTDHTFSPWIGCTEVSAACDHCYARDFMTKKPRWATAWSGDRFRTSADYWKQPLKWNREAERSGIRRKVFCASLADVFDNQVDPAWRADLFGLIEATQSLDWLLLTKRPQNAKKMIIAARRSILGSNEIDERHVSWAWPNVWLGTTTENQEEADRRIPHLLAVPAKVHFLSMEPLLGPVDLTCVVRPTLNGAFIDNALTGFISAGVGGMFGHKIDWVITGGESGPGARPSNPQWFRDIGKQCADAGVPWFHKQHGDWADYTQLPERVNSWERTEPGQGRIFWQTYHPAPVRVDPYGRSAFETVWPFRLDHDPGPCMVRVGKAKAGALLDGVTHKAMPGDPT